MKDVQQILNRPGQQFWIIAWVGKFDPQNHRTYQCVSSRPSIVEGSYPLGSLQQLRKHTHWEIEQIGLDPVRDGRKKSWELVRRSRFALIMSESENVWPHIRSVILEDFPKSADVQTGIEILESVDD